MKGKLIFTHGTMEAGKSAELIQKAYQFDRKGFKVVVLSPSADIRSTEGTIQSRIGLNWPCIKLSKGDPVEQALSDACQGLRPDIVLVDEAQFIDKDQVDELAFLADTRGLFVMAYGLRVDFNGELFPATKRFMEVADRIDEMPSICECGAKATHHVKLGGSNNQVSCGAAEKYKSVCRRRGPPLQGTRSMQVNSIVTVKELDAHTKVQDVIFHDYGGDHEVSRVRRSPKVVFICHDVVNDAVLLQYRTNLNDMNEGYYIPEVSIGPNDEFEPALKVLDMTCEQVVIKSAVEVTRLNADSREFSPVAFYYCIFDSRQLSEDDAMWATTPASMIIQRLHKGNVTTMEEYVAANVLKSMRHQ